MTKWYLTARNNSTLATTAVGIENDFENFTCVLKEKRPASWRLQLRRESPFAQYFLPDSADQGLKNGILFQVDNEDGQGLQQVLSGPQTSVNPSRDQANTGLVVATGGDGLWYLSKRLALPTPHFPLPYYLTSIGLPAPSEPGWYAITTPTNMKRLYLLGEASGTTATDVTGTGNGIYNGTLSYGQAGLVDDPHTCVDFGGTGFVQTGTVGIPSGNAAWTWFCWVQLAANPGANINAFSFGANPAAAKSTTTLYVDTNGKPHNQISGASDLAGATALSLNKPHLLALSWDGTTCVGYLDGVAFASQTPGTLTIGTTGTGVFGAYVDGTGKWTGKMGFCGVYAGALSLATLQTMYAIGVSRHTYLGYDTFGLNQASTQILYYVQKNAGASGGLANYGLAAPAASNATFGASRVRPAPNLAMPTSDPALGSTIYGTAREDNLLDLAGALAVQSSPELTFKTVQSGSSLVFSVSGFRDQSATAIFSPDRGNVSQYSWTESVPPGNHVIAGGQNPTPGTPTARTFAEGGNDTTAAAFGFATEEFVDARQTDDPNGLTSAVNGALAADGVIPLNINATLIDQPGVLYFKGPGNQGYDLGDLVQVVLDGYTLKQPIRQIEIDLQPGEVATIMPVIGTPDAAIMQEFSQLQQHAAEQGVVIKALSTNY